MALIRLLFGLTAPINQKTYLIAGLSLAALKYAIDFTVVYLTTGKVWTLLAYLSPMLIVRHEAIRPAPEYLLWAMAMYALPFAWIGLSMSVRRASDAGLSPWLGIGFLAPLLNFVFIGVLCLLPTRNQNNATVELSDKSSPVDLKAAFLGIGTGVLLTLAMVAFSVFILGEYGWSLFIGTPLVVGMLVGYFTNRNDQRSVGSTLVSAAVAITLSGLATLLFAIEGIICITMAMVPAMIVALPGSLVGRAIANSSLGRGKNIPSITAVMLALPILGGAETLDTSSPLYEVVTTVEINAPPQKVWDHVIDFSELAPPPTWVQRTGIAYPIRAKLDGEGVGAVRHCEFSTGPFIEPITHWEPGVRLSFDVASQPKPMDEWSPYNHIHPPHLDGYLRSKKGEFRFVELPGGRTRLEGSTWYEVDISPRAYWSIITDSLIHRIHLRVLNHVKAETELSVARPQH